MYLFRERPPLNKDRQYI